MKSEPLPETLEEIHCSVFQAERTRGETRDKRALLPNCNGWEYFIDSTIQPVQQ